MITTTQPMITPKTQTNFGSSYMAQKSISSSKKNYHPRENKSLFGKNKNKHVSTFSLSSQVDWNSKSSSRVKLGLGERKISDPLKL